MEAADDICYRIADIEDGYFSGLLDFASTRDLFSPFLTESQLCYVRELEAKEEKDSCIHICARSPSAKAFSPPWTVS